jgi:hypothetical protein
LIRGGKSEAPLASLGVASWSDRAALRCFRVGGAPCGCGCRRVRCDQLVGGEADQPRRPGLSRGEGGRGLTVALAAVVVLASGAAVQPSARAAAGGGGRGSAQVERGRLAGSVERARPSEDRKRYEVHQRTTRADWNDGERVPVFWPLEIDIRRRASKRDLETLQPVAKRACRPEMRMKREGEKQAQDKPQSIRQLHRQAERTHTAAAART